MASMANKIPSINMIFEKGAGGENYTPKALLYQDILKYSVSFSRDYPENKNHRRFTAWELTAWLIDNNDDYYNYYADPSTYNTPRKVRIASRLEHIKELVDEFA